MTLRPTIRVMLASCIKPLQLPWMEGRNQICIFLVHNMIVHGCISFALVSKIKYRVPINRINDWEYIQQEIKKVRNRNPLERGQTPVV